jgi:cytochrome c oxidase subunit I+III
VTAAVLVLGAWGLVVAARRLNRRGRGSACYAALATAAGLSIAGLLALLAGPRLAGLDPAASAYTATVWVLVSWAALHVLVGVVMQLYCVARRIAGWLTPDHDADLANVVLYWHFTAVTVAGTVAIVAGFPMVA